MQRGLGAEVKLLKSNLPNYFSPLLLRSLAPLLYCNGQAIIGGSKLKLILARPHGFCAGVVRAIDVVELALSIYGPPVYVRKEIVHNKHVVDDLRTKGAVFVDEFSEAPDGATMIFSAHGISPAVRNEAARKGFKVIDATCPLVTKVHLEAIKHTKKGYTVLLVGHQDHDEVIGTMGEAPKDIVLVSTVEDVENIVIPNPEQVSYVTQTTLSMDDTREIVDALKRKFPRIVGPASSDICYATQNRQEAVKELALQAEVVLVIGSKNSSNSNRLCEVASAAGAKAYLIDSAGDIQPSWIQGVESIGITAGASTPEILVERVVKYLEGLAETKVSEIETKREDVKFALPQELSFKE